MPDTNSIANLNRPVRTRDNGHVDNCSNEHHLSEFGEV